MTVRDEVIEAITREVLAALAGESGDACTDCLGACAVHSSEKVRAVVDSGATRVSFQGNGAEVPHDLHRYIDHTLLKPDVTAAQIDRLCDEAAEYRFPAVCVNPTWVGRAAGRLRGTDVAVASVVGFPLGATTTEVKSAEARQVLRSGAREIDMVINIGELKSGNFARVRDDVARVSDACREVGALNKVIIETALLTDQEKVIACRMAVEAKAHYVKTSTGFGPGGATVYDVALMREAVGPALGVKASGGIRTAHDVEEMIAAGATRIGASAGVQIVSGGSADEQQY